MKKLLTILFISLVLSGCEQQEKPETIKKTEDGSVEAVINENIDALIGKPWSFKSYKTILDNQINKRDLTELEKEALTTKLKAVYSQTIMDEASDIINNHCSDETHSRLEESMKELKDHNFRAKGYEQLKQQYDAHQAEMAFVARTRSYQSVTNWNTAYDDAFESRMLKEAVEHRAKNPVCSYLKKNLEESSLKSAFNARRKNYAAKITDLYCKGSEWRQADETRLSSMIQKTLKGAIPSDLKAKIEKFKEDHKPAEAM